MSKEFIQDGKTYKIDDDGLVWCDDKIYAIGGIPHFWRTLAIFVAIVITLLIIFYIAAYTDWLFTINGPIPDHT